MGKLLENFDIRLTKPHFSCKVYRAYLTYLKTKHPDISLEKLCEEAGLSLNYLENENNFVSVVFDQKFTELCIAKTKEDDFCFQVGAQSMTEEVLGKLVHLLVTRTLSVASIFQKIPKLTEVYSKVTRVEIIDQRANSVQFRFYALTYSLSPTERVALKKNFDNIFQNSLGHYTAIPSSQGLPPAHVDYSRSEGPDGFPIYEMKLEFESSYPLLKSLYLVLPLSGSILAAWAIHLGFQGSSLLYILSSIASGALWLMAGRSYFKSLRDKFDQAIRAVQNSDQRYASLQTAQSDLKRLSDSYKKFVPWEFIDLLELKDINEIKLGQSVEREITVLFLDIRNFTKMSERMTSQEVLLFLNGFFEFIAPAIRENQGFIDKYMGDGIMAIFPHSPRHGIEAGIEIKKRLNLFNKERVTFSKEPIKIGIGINTGKVTLGTVGCEDQMQNTALSDVVNSASRLEQETKNFGNCIMVSEKTLIASEMKDLIGCRCLGNIKIPGRERPITAFEIFEADEPSEFKFFDETRMDFEYAVKLFEAGDATNASKLFGAMLLKNPRDYSSAHYLKLADAQTKQTASLKKSGES